MKQTDLNRAVAKTTGESVSTIDRMGFQLMSLPSRPLQRLGRRRRRKRQQMKVRQSA